MEHRGVSKRIGLDSKEGGDVALKGLRGMRYGVNGRNDFARKDNER